MTREKYTTYDALKKNVCSILQLLLLQCKCICSWRLVICGQHDSVMLLYSADWHLAVVTCKEMSEGAKNSNFTWLKERLWHWETNSSTLCICFFILRLCSPTVYFGRTHSLLYPRIQQTTVRTLVIEVATERVNVVWWHLFSTIQANC